MKTLVADDELVSRKKLQKILGSFGDCQAAKNGMDAVEAVKAAALDGTFFDLITLDIMMPDMDGITTLIKIRAEEKRWDPIGLHRSKILMVSSHSRKEAVLACIKAGADSYIVKPIDRESLSAKLEQMGINVTEAATEMV